MDLRSSMPSFDREQYIAMFIGFVFLVIGIIAEYVTPSLGNTLAAWNFHGVGNAIAAFIEWIDVTLRSFWDGLVWVLNSGDSLIQFIIRYPERLIEVEFKGNPMNAEPYWHYMWAVEGEKPALPLVSFGALISIAIISFISYLASKIEVAIFTFGSLSLLWFMGLWPMTVQTLALAFVAVIGALLVAFPLGIMASLSDTFYGAVRPIVDMMQTMPAYVYFVPAVALWGIGKAAGIVATTIFAIPPALRMTNTGLRNVPEIYDEVGDAFGANTLQKLKKIHIPSALPEIMQGVNQCIMYALAMAVIAGWLGAPGLGKLVKDAIWFVKLGPGIEGGLGIVFLAVILDRSSQGLITKAAREYGTEVEEASAAAGF